MRAIDYDLCALTSIRYITRVFNKQIFCYIIHLNYIFPVLPLRVVTQMGEVIVRDLIIPTRI